MHDTIQHRPRVAIYARYSSRLQKPTSIEDQVRLCQERAESLGGVIVRVYPDFEASAASGHSQPGLDTLLHDAKRGRIDIVLAEALDRISRDQEHIHGVHKRLAFRNVRLFTLDEGEIESIHISIGGYMNAAYIENLKAKTKRGQIGAVHAGRVPGPVSYGYRQANRIDDRGQPIRGLREIHPDEAPIVRRIFTDFAAGASAREIAATLNREGVPGPRGRPWTPDTISGHRARRTGILNNELYVGRVIYGRHEYVRDPDTGKRQGRPLPQDQWIVQEVPEFEIVEYQLWDTVQKRRHAGHDRRSSPSSYTPLPLTGRVRCGICDGAMTIVKPRRYACHAHTKLGLCDNPRGADATRLENSVCGLLAKAIAQHEGASDLLHQAVSHSRTRHDRLTAEIDNRKARIARLLEGLEAGRHSIAAHNRIVELEKETSSLELELDALPSIPKTGGKALTKRLYQRLGVLARAIDNNGPSSDTRRQALLEVAPLIESIRIHPLPGRGKFRTELIPHVDALVALGMDPHWSFNPPLEEPAP